MLNLIKVIPPTQDGSVEAAPPSSGGGDIQQESPYCELAASTAAATNRRVINRARPAAEVAIYADIDHTLRLASSGSNSFKPNGIL